MRPHQPAARITAVSTTKSANAQASGLWLMKEPALVAAELQPLVEGGVSIAEKQAIG